ncbi:hypothetical protein TruAng_009895 [Truncatella angustata]|nr:hypothetical protein TruAng_009895 [Truncatella angustata]
MKFNETIAISTPKVLLVPYDAHHVPQYHTWMEDAAIREATASDRLTLDEEYENQTSWRTSADKLTFIVCKPLESIPAVAVIAGEADDNERMVGDINMFLTPWEEDEAAEDGETQHAAGVPLSMTNRIDASAQRYCVGEVDIMIADTANRGKGLGKAAVSTLLWFIRRNVSAILAEYAASTEEKNNLEMKELLVRIQATNEGSQALFRGLGFERRGDINYFGEVEMVLKNFNHGEGIKRVEGYGELPFDRSKLPN